MLYVTMVYGPITAYPHDLSADEVFDPDVWPEFPSGKQLSSDIFASDARRPSRMAARRARKTRSCNEPPCSWANNSARPGTALRRAILAVPGAWCLQQ